MLVDEVLAVGDRAFRDKCYHRMEALLADGKTLFLVSHSEPDLRRFSTRGLYLKRGELEMDAPMEDVLDQYMEDLMGDERTPPTEWEQLEAKAKREDGRIKRRLQRDAARLE